MSEPGVRTVMHHEDECYGSRLHCSWHHVDEPDDQLLAWCLECHHAYRSREDLMAAWDLVMPGHDFRAHAGIGPPGCAYCGHDW